MTVFDLTKNSYFLNSIDAKTIRVLDYQVPLDTVTSDENPPVSFPAVIGPGQSYSALKLFGVVIKGNTFTRLAHDLCDSRCIPNREGFCILNNTSAAVQGLDVVLGRQYLRLNDLFMWSKYGVTPTITTVWNRRDIKSHRILVNYGELSQRLASSERSLKQRKEELEQCKAKLDKKGKNRERELRDKDEGDVEELQKELKKLKLKLKDAEMELAECKEDSHKRLEAMEEEKEELLKELNEIKNDQSDSLEEEMQELEEELRETKKKLRKCKETLKEREEEMEEMEEELRAKDKEIKRLRNDLAELIDTDSS